MANVRNSNTFYIDTQYSGASDELAVKNIKVKYITVTSTNTNAQVVLTDSGTKKFDLRIAATNTTQYFPLTDCPIVFSTSLRPTTLTNAIVTCVVEETRG